MWAVLNDECHQLLELQHGVIARWQLTGAGLHPAACDGLLRTGRWRQLYRGVYASYTGEPPRTCLLWAAVLRAGEGAALSHNAAAELDCLVDGPAETIHVTVGHARRVRFDSAAQSTPLPPITLHRSGRIDQARHPVRTPPRTRIEETVIDLTQVAASFDAAFSWLSAGCGRRLVTPGQLRAAVDRRQRLRWHSEIRRALGDIDDGVHSGLEYRYVRDVERAHRLPTARRQARSMRGARSQYADNLYDEVGVVVELDGGAAHLVKDRWRDIHRDNYGAATGIITLRYSWSDIVGRPCHVAAEIATVLQLRGWQGQPARCGPTCTAASA